MTYFKTFIPRTERAFNNIYHSAADELNRWLEANPNVEIIDWHPFAVGTGTAYYITIQYKEKTKDV